MKKFLLALLFSTPLMGQAPPGWWQVGGGVGPQLPCSVQSPYVLNVSPTDGKTYYLRVDANANWSDDGVARDGQYTGSQGCGDHCHLAYLATSLGAPTLVMVPLRGGQAYPGVGTTYPPPFRDAPLWPERVYPDGRRKTVCDLYRELAGPNAPACPSGVSLEVYSIQQRSTYAWTGAWPSVNATWRVPQCSGAPPPTRTSRTATPVVSRTPSRTPVRTVGPCPHGSPCPRTPTPRRTSTVVPATATAIPRTATAIPRTPTSIPVTPGRTVIPVPTPRPPPVTVVRPTPVPRSSGCAVAVVAVLLLASRLW